METYIFISKDTMGKLTVHLYILSLCLTTQNQFPNICYNESKIPISKVYRKNLNYFSE